ARACVRIARQPPPAATDCSAKTRLARSAAPVTPVATAVPASIEVACWPQSQRSSRPCDVARGRPHELLEFVRRTDSTTRRTDSPPRGREGAGVAFAAGLPPPRRSHRLAQPRRRQLLRLKPHARPGNLYMARHLELVASERHHAYGNSGGQRLLRDAHTTVAHDAHGAIK